MIFTLEDEETYEKQEICHKCKEPFKEMDGDLLIPSLKGIKVKDHCHYTGKFRWAAHNGCNILYRKTKDIPVFFHNLGGYDGHIIFQNLCKVDSIKEPEVVAKTLEKFITFSIGNLKFKDSLQFLNSSLDKLVSNLAGKDGKKEVLFSNTWDYFKKNWGHLPEEAFDMLTRKGTLYTVYNYTYMDSFSRFDE